MSNFSIKGTFIPNDYFPKYDTKIGATSIFGFVIECNGERGTIGLSIYQNQTKYYLVSGEIDKSFDFFKYFKYLDEYDYCKKVHIHIPFTIFDKEMQDMIDFEITRLIINNALYNIELIGVNNNRAANIIKMVLDERDIERIL